MPHKVLITDYYYPTLDEERRVLEGTGIEICDGNGRCKDADDVIALGRDADAIITLERLSRAIFIFVLAEIATVLILVFFPRAVWFLPHTLGFK